MEYCFRHCRNYETILKGVKKDKIKNGGARFVKLKFGLIYVNASFLEFSNEFLSVTYYISELQNSVCIK